MGSSAGGGGSEQPESTKPISAKGAQNLVVRIVAAGAEAVRDPGAEVMEAILKGP
ncbi:hypothetical protein GCM10025777_32910 [Membranihabitans marinus]|uniref:Uncharacterized protein n=1 Tax=Nesterenkonia rhizosphaerae TaxID=1348272 RepID=A0ABP9FUE6_9MICC